jgi:DNA primase
MTKWVDFEAIKRRVPISAVLEHYRIQGLKRSGKVHLRGRCPLHVGEGRETFHVDTAEQVFHCFSCRVGGSVLDLVMAIESCGLRQAAEQLSSWRVIPVNESEPSSLAIVKPTVTKKIEPVPPLGFRLRGIDSRHPYLKIRGIHEATAAEFGVGFYLGPGLMHRRLVIPIEDEAGQVVGYCGRALDGSEPRYKFPPRFPKSQLLFNLHRATATRQSHVIVVEGFFDCLKVYQAGFRSVVALMGSSLYQRQRELLVQHFRHVSLMLDGDVAGRRAGSAIAPILSANCPTDVIELADGAQPDQLNEKSLHQILGSQGGASAIQ